MRRLIQFEMRKLFSRRLAQASLALLLLLSLLLGVSTWRNMYAFDGKSREGTGAAAVEIDQAIAENYAGILTDEKVQQILSEFAPDPTLDLHGMNAAYLYQNALQSSVALRFSDLNGGWNGVGVSDVFGDEEIRVGYVYGWLSTSQNLAKLFLVLSLVLVILLAPVFGGEYGGVDNLILTSRYGRTKCAAAKLLAAMLSALLVTALLAAANLALALVLYGADGLDCSILLAPVEFVEGYIPFNLTCGAMLAYQVLLAFTGAVSVAGLTHALSALCQSPLTALAASAALYLFPVLLPVPETSWVFRFVSLLPVYHAQFRSLMSVEQMANGWLHAVWAVPVSLALACAGALLARRAFAKHQVC